MCKFQTSVKSWDEITHIYQISLNSYAIDNMRNVDHKIPFFDWGRNEETNNYTVIDNTSQLLLKVLQYMPGKRASKFFIQKK